LAACCANGVPPWFWTTYCPETALVSLAALPKAPAPRAAPPAGRQQLPFEILCFLRRREMQAQRMPFDVIIIPSDDHGHGG
jgi:hypothetical protein